MWNDHIPCNATVMKRSTWGELPWKRRRRWKTQVSRNISDYILSEQLVLSWSHALCLKVCRQKGSSVSLLDKIVLGISCNLKYFLGGSTLATKSTVTYVVFMQSSIENVENKATILDKFCLPIFAILFCSRFWGPSQIKRKYPERRYSVILNGMFASVFVNC